MTLLFKDYVASNSLEELGLMNGKELHMAYYNSSVLAVTLTEKALRNLQLDGIANNLASKSSNAS
jgi:hypothetical protein